MSNRYKTRFSELHQSDKKAFVPFNILGWPDKKKSLMLIEQMIKSGASALELGIAFSDPVADGPIIQKASYETIASGFSVNDAFSMLAEIRKLDSNIPIGILVYFNLVLAKGIDTFFSTAKESGVDAILIADLPPESAEEVVPIAKATGIELIFIVSPLTDRRRLQKILSHGGGFLYLVSRLGVTGTHERSYTKDLDLAQLVKEVKSMTDLPVCAGFGISSVSDAQSMFAVGVDGVITASQIIKTVQSNDFETALSLLNRYYSEMLNACSQPAKVLASN